ncbi:essential meiotic endonuclease 1A, partial [Striga asiatica]
INNKITSIAAALHKSNVTRKIGRPACFFSAGVPLRWRISRSTRPRDMSPNVRPDIMPAKRTRKHEIPAYVNHNTVPNSISAPSRAALWSAPPFLIAMDTSATALIGCMIGISLDTLPLLIFAPYVRSEKGEIQGQPDIPPSK